MIFTIKMQIDTSSQKEAESKVAEIGGKIIKVQKAKQQKTYTPIKTLVSLYNGGMTIKKVAAHVGETVGSVAYRLEMADAVRPRNYRK